MDTNKMGIFIAERRKSKNLTQQELADILHLSNRTISKWECGKGIPDSSVMLELCKALDISINELLCGENIPTEEYKIKADENILALMSCPQNTYIQNLISVLCSLFSATLLFIFITLCIYLNVMSGTYLRDYMDIPALLIVLGTTAIILAITGLSKDFFKAFRISFSNNIITDEVEACIASIKTVMLSALLSGLALSVASLIGTMVNLTKKTANTLNIAFSVSLLGLLYGVIICVIMLPLLGRLHKKKYHSKNTES